MNKQNSEFRLFAPSRDGLAAWCIACHLVASRNHYLANKDKSNALAKAWASANKEKVRKAGREYNDRNKVERAAEFKAWASRNLDARRVTTAKRKAAKLRATPAWSNHIAIRSIYAQASYLQKMNGVRMHVDHIVPLQSDLVCGLHCEANLQVMSGAENESKKNYFWPDMPGIEQAYAQGKLFAEPERAKQEQGLLV